METRPALLLRGRRNSQNCNQRGRYRVPHTLARPDRPAPARHGPTRPCSTRHDPKPTRANPTATRPGLAGPGQHCPAQQDPGRPSRNRRVVACGVAGAGSCCGLQRLAGHEAGQGRAGGQRWVGRGGAGLGRLARRWLLMLPCLSASLPVRPHGCMHACMGTQRCELRLPGAPAAFTRLCWALG